MTSTHAPFHAKNLRICTGAKKDGNFYLQILWEFSHICQSNDISQHKTYISGYGRSIFPQESINSVSSTQKTLWRDSQSYRCDQRKLVKASCTPGSGGPQWIDSPSLVPLAPGNYREHIDPYTPTIKGSQQDLWCQDPVSCCLSVVISAG